MTEVAPSMFGITGHLDYIIMYHLYGLAFFSMGLAMALEAGRSPLLAEARILRPLAVFGILHGIHEWLELYTLQAGWLDLGPGKPFILIRLLLLTFSFLSLIAYGVQVLRPKDRLLSLDTYVGGGMLALYIALILISHALPWESTPNCLRCADALARYLLAMPGGILAAVALRFQSRDAGRQNKPPELAICFLYASWGFGLYGVSQIFVAPAELWPAPWLNSEDFLDLTGTPIQVIRAALALFTTYHLIRATQIVDRQRQHQLLAAQKERLAALEQAQAETEKRRQLRRQFLRHVVLAQEEERSRISRELHDETAQILTAASLNMGALRQMLGNSPQALELLDRSQVLCKEMSQILHRLVRDLRPAQLDDLGLIAAISHLVDVNRQQHHLTVQFTVSGRRQRLDPLIETVLYRVTQEALTNIARHAQTDHATMELHFGPDQVTLQIHDTGAGFDQDLLPLDHGMGLAGMHERVAAVAGQIQIDSAPGKGTFIDVAIPIVKSTISPSEEGNTP
ncbi:MAG: sensor histidine kinase [Thermodesulfobacteriota bacterium]